MFICERPGCSEYSHGGRGPFDKDTCPLAVDIHFMITGINRRERSDKRDAETVFLSNSQRRSGGIIFKCKQHADYHRVVKEDFDDHLFEEQQELTFEEALEMFTKYDNNKDKVVQVFHFEYRMWR